MKKIILQGITLEELSTSILNGVDDRIQSLVEKPNKPRTYLSRKQVKELLGVSYVTLNEWGKKGILIPYRIGCKVYFKSDELDTAFKKIHDRS